MSDEMKPAAWVNPLHLPNGAMPRTMPMISIVKWHSSTLPLYTADQLAEAVAKERERCARVCEEDAPKGDYSILGNVGSALKRAAQTIREGASA